MGYMTQEEKMKAVLALAAEGMEQGELPIAAIVYHGDTLIAKAFTTEKKDGGFLIHADLKAMLAMDQLNYPLKARREMQLFVNLEPCMMCFGAAIHSFIGEVCYSFDSPTDGGAAWAEKSWAAYHKSSVFMLPRVHKGILAEESRDLFRKFLKQCPNGGYADWVKSLV